MARPGRTSIAASAALGNLKRDILLLFLSESSNSLHSWISQDLLGPVDASEFAGGELDVIDGKRACAGLRLAVKAQVADAKILEGMILVEGQRFARPGDGWVWEGEDQRPGGVVMNRTRLVFIVAMDVPVKDRYVVIGGEHVHDIVPVAGEPLPIGTKVEERTVREHHDWRSLWKSSQVFLKPGQLLAADFGLGPGDVVERDKVNAAVVEGVIAFPEELAVERAVVESSVMFSGNVLDHGHIDPL